MHLGQIINYDGAEIKRLFGPRTMTESLSGSLRFVLDILNPYRDLLALQFFVLR